jgi:hypothetical protein
LGTGKTLTTIWVAGRLWLNIESNAVMSHRVNPLFWQEEVSRSSRFPYSLAVLNRTDRKIENLRQIPTNDLQVAVINTVCWRLKTRSPIGARLIVATKAKIKTTNR